MMAQLSPAPINAEAVDDRNRLSSDLVQWIRLLEAKIRELEARIAALEAP